MYGILIHESIWLQVEKEKVKDRFMEKFNIEWLGRRWQTSKRYPLQATSDVGSKPKDFGILEAK